MAKVESVLVGEVWPAEVTLGEVESFDYYVASTFGADNSGFDRIEIPDEQGAFVGKPFQMGPIFSQYNALPEG